MATLIEEQVRTLQYLRETNHLLFNSKLEALKGTLELETNSLTAQLYHDLISLPKYLVKLEALYNNLKEVYND